MTTNQEIRQLGPKEIQNEIMKVKGELLKMKLAVVSGHSKEVHKMKELKNYLARLLTISSELNMAEMKTTPKKSVKTAAPKKETKPEEVKSSELTKKSSKTSTAKKSTVKKETSKK